jgi:hypothetical protein
VEEHRRNPRPAHHPPARIGRLRLGLLRARRADAWRLDRLFPQRISRGFPSGAAAHRLAGNATANAWGIEFVILAAGLLVSHILGTPVWLMPAVRAEFYIKVGIILMGASLVFYFVLDFNVDAKAKPMLPSPRNLCFAAAFVSIGLETKFTELLTTEEGRPFRSFLGALAFNLVPSPASASAACCLTSPRSSENYGSTSFRSRFASICCRVRHTGFIFFSSISGSWSSRCPAAGIVEFE